MLSKSILIHNHHLLQPHHDDSQDQHRPDGLYQEPVDDAEGQVGPATEGRVEGHGQAGGVDGGEEAGAQGGMEGGGRGEVGGGEEGVGGDGHVCVV